MEGLLYLLYLFYYEAIEDWLYGWFVKLIDKPAVQPVFYCLVIVLIKTEDGLIFIFRNSNIQKLTC